MGTKSATEIEAPPNARRSFGDLAGLLWTSAAFMVSVNVQALPDEAATEQVRARLVASVDAVYPGAEIELGLNQRIIPRWHTYWQNPGDSGLPTSIEWRLPQGSSSGDMLWPVPSRIDLGPVTNYGYSDEVTLLTPVRVPDSVKPGTAFSIEATVKWLVCEETCIPQQVALGLTLPVVTDRHSVGPGSSLIAEARARLPVENPWPARVRYGTNTISLQLDGTELRSSGVTNIHFFSDTWGRIVHGAPQTWRNTGDGIELTLQPGDAPAHGGDVFTGVLTVTENTPDGPVTRGFEVEAWPRSATPNDKTAGDSLGLASALGLALLAGIILNLMPCVFPILSLKALHLLQQGGQSRRTSRLQGLAYTTGVLVSFAVLAGILIVLKSAGSAVGWGFQFQSPVFVLLLAYLMFAIGLCLSGSISLGGSLVGVGHSYASRAGLSGSFFTGVLASVVAAPCTAPFMGAAIAYALAQPPLPLTAVLIALGVGLALPFLLLSFWPALQRRLPRPGAWMENLKQALAFPMYGTAAWLTWVLSEQAGRTYLPLALMGMLAIAFAAWLLQVTRDSPFALKRLSTILAIFVIVTPITGAFLMPETVSRETVRPSLSGPSEQWEPYAPERLKALRAQGQPVFLNLTAAWCISCLVNERVALNTDSVKEAFRNAKLVYLKGDWTSRDPLIGEKLGEFGRSGVPLYVHYPAGIDSKPIVLPQILTPQVVLSAIGAD